MKLLSVSFLLILLFCVSSTSHASGAEKQSSEKILSETKQKAPANDYKQISENKNPPVIKPQSQKPSEPKKQPETSKTPENWYDFLWQANMPNWLVIAGWGIAALIAWRTLKSLNNQVKANIVAAKAAEEGANSAVRQTTLIANLERPWLVFRPSTPDLTFYIGQRIFFPWTVPLDCSIVNTGKSPAFLTRLSTHLVFSPFPVPDVEPTYRERNAIAKMVLPPNAGHGWRMSIKFTQSETDDFKAGKTCVMVYGLVEYKDALGEMTHKTRFCCYWFVEGDQRVFSPVGPPIYIEYT